MCFRFFHREQRLFHLFRIIQVDCTVPQVSNNTVLLPLWQSNTLPPFPDLYFPVGQSTANPKSLPGSPWRRASVEQMASVCRAAIKEGARAGKRKWVRIRGEQGQQREAASASGLCTDVHICVRSNAHTRPFMLQWAPSRVFPAKTNNPPPPSHETSTVWDW